MKAVAIIIAGITAVAGAQGTMTITWSGSDTGNGNGVIEPGESAVMTLFASMDPGAVGFASSNFDIGGDAAWAAGTVDSYVNLVDSLGTGLGTLGVDNEITGIECFQVPMFGNPDFDASNPIALYTLIWTPAEYVAMVVSISSQNHTNFTVYTDDFGTTEEYMGEAFGGLIKIVPAPGPLALLAFGGLAATRRRC